MTKSRDNADNWAGDISGVTAGTGLTGGGTTGAVTLAIDSTVATLSGTQTLTNKTVALGSNTVSGTLAQFNTAVTDADLVSIAGTETLTNKTLTSPTITTPTLTLDSNTTTTNGRIAWVQASDKLVVGDGTSAVEFAPSTILTNAQTASYTLVLTDKDRLVEINNAGATTLTVPTDASVNFPIGSQINILQTGAGQITVGGAGVTINSTPGLKLRAQWSSATLIKRAANTWVLVGDLSA